MSDNAAMVPGDSAEKAVNAKPTSLLSRRVAAALVDAMVVGLVGALIPLLVAFMLAWLEVKATGVISDAGTIFYLGNASALGVNWIFPLLLPVGAGSWAVWIWTEGFRFNIVLPIVILAIAPIYEVGSLCSPWRATIGKRLLGLVVQRQNLSRLIPSQVILRTALRAVSAATILGYCVAFVTNGRRCLHDLVCVTEVTDASANTPTADLKRHNMIAFVVISIVIGVTLGVVAMSIIFQHDIQKLLKH